MTISLLFLGRFSKFPAESSDHRCSYGNKQVNIRTVTSGENRPYLQGNKPVSAINAICNYSE